MSETVRLRCPDYSSGICTKNGCNGFLVRPRWTGTAEDGADLYSGACPTNEGIGYFNNVRAFIDSSKPIDFDDAVQRLYKQELADRKQNWLAIRDALIDYGLTIPIEEWPVPKEWNDKNVEFAFQHLREQIKHSLDQICDKDSVMRPDDHWEELIPLILSLDLDCHAYSIMQEYGDGIYKTVTLADGETLNISRNSNNAHISYMPFDMCKEELGAYIDAGIEISRQLNSTTRKTWRKVKQLFHDHRHELPENKRILEEIAPMLRDARTELVLDIEDAAEGARPVNAIVVGFSTEGGRSLRTEMKDKGGRPANSYGVRKALTQKDVANLFMPPCTADIVGNWESFGKSGTNRGSVPPSVNYNGEQISYSSELRKNPTEENLSILRQMADEYHAIHGVKDGIAHKKMIHCRSEESLYQASRR